MDDFIRFRITQLHGNDMPEAYFRFVERVIEQAWADYSMAGCPFGPTDHGLTIWCEFDQVARNN